MKTLFMILQVCVYFIGVSSLIAAINTQYPSIEAFILPIFIVAAIPEVAVLWEWSTGYSQGNIEGYRKGLRNGIKIGKRNS